MGFLAFLLLGLIGGLIARALLPGKQRGGFILTLVLGVLGAMLGGWLAGVLFSADVYTSFFSLVGWIAAIVGALIVTLIFNALFRRRRA
jgi:uncharacterized membrane protein YeaQ/YmgE (transglycosylase-associated protein family)